MPGYFRLSTISGVCALALAAGVRADDTNAPVVYAAWSQIIGETDVGALDAFTAPSLEIRFVIDGGGACDLFRVTGDRAGPSAAGALTPGIWATGPLDVTVCSAALDPAWGSAQLWFQPPGATAPGIAATLTSIANFGSDFDSPGNPAEDTPGPSNGAEIVVAGPAAIGQHGDLRMVTLADTGCKGKTRDGKRQFQDCTDGTARDQWPLSRMIQRAATLDGAGRAPDLVIHAGDYRYFFETENTADSWALWRKDFFPVAQPLLLAAPWAFARGNHEGCGGADLPYGAGYFQFFGFGAYTDCAALTTAEPYVAPWYFDVRPAGGGADMAARFVILDTNAYVYTGADFRDTPALRNFGTARDMAEAASWPSWWIKHTPSVQMIYYNHGPHYGDGNFRGALLQETGPVTSVGDRFCNHASGAACRPAQVLLGHEHLFQDVTFTDGQGDFVFPRQFIVGHGGVELDSGSPAPFGHTTCTDSGFEIGPLVPGTGGNTTPAQYQAATGVVHTEVAHGLVVWTRMHDQDVWPTGWRDEYLWAGQPGIVAATPPAALRNLIVPCR